jgi:hypothetical protein
LLASCTVESGPLVPADVVGSYRCQNGPELWDEVDVQAGGACTWWACRSIPARRVAYEGSWTLSGDRLRVSIHSGPDYPGLSVPELHVRRWEEHVYIVPATDLRWFDDNGPMNELCFNRADAPLLPPPGMMRAN